MKEKEASRTFPTRHQASPPKLLDKVLLPLSCTQTENGEKENGLCYYGEFIPAELAGEIP